MARLGKFTESIVVNVSSVLSAAASARVSVYDVDTTNAITIYTDSGGSTAVAAAPQITLGSDGLLEFYVRSQDRTFDLYIQPPAADPTQFTAFTLADMGATFDDAVFYASEYATLQAAVTAMTAGSKLIVDQDYTLTTVLSVAKNDITIEGMNRNTRLTLQTNGNCDVVDLAGARVTIRMLEIDGNQANQAGAGPYYGIDAPGSSDCLIEDVYIHDVKGSGLRWTNTTDMTFRRVRAQDCTVHGFFHDASAAAAARITFDDCYGFSNDSDGWNATPPHSDLTFDKCRARSNGANGFRFAGDATSVTVTGMSLDTCSGLSNTARGLYVNSNSNNGTIIDGLQVNGGHYSLNTQEGIRIEATDTTDPGTDAVIRNFKLNGPTCETNGLEGILIKDRCAYGTILAPHCYNNAATGAASGIVLTTTHLGNALADYSDNRRCKAIQVISPVVVYDTGTGPHAYGVSFAAGTRYCVLKDPLCFGMGTAVYSDAGKNNVVKGVQTYSSATDLTRPGGGGPAFPFAGDQYITPGAQGGYWVVARTKGLDATSTRVPSSRITPNTRILSLVPLDAAAASSFAASGWYQATASTMTGTATGAAGSTANMGYVSIKHVGTGGDVTGAFAVFLAEALP